MHLNRRQLLLLGGTLTGLGVATGVHKALTAGLGQSSLPTPVETPPAPPPTPEAEATPAQVAIAPDGLFAPVRGDRRIVVISDLNSQYGSTTYEAEVLKAIELLPGWQPDLILGGGDMVAGQYPSLTRQQILDMWAGFDRHIGAPIRQMGIPFGFTIGNHDASGAKALNGNYLFGQERELAAAYWNDPAHDVGLNFVDRGNYPYNYTFLHKDIFGLVWDASTSRIPAEQIAWAEASLASDTAQSAKLRVAIGHLPLFAVAVGRDEPGEVLANTDQLVNLLTQYDVHTYVSGHHHAYFPGHKGSLELLHASALGAGPRPLLNSSLAPFKTLTVMDVDFADDAIRYTTYNMQTLEVVDQTTLPRLIPGPTGQVLRLDVAESDLTPEEKAMTWQMSR